MSKDLVSLVVQLLISLGGTGLLIQLLLLRPNRRKIAGEASTNEANAASTLSGAALQFVENAQQQGREADARAKEAYDELEKSRHDNESLWAELNRTRWRVHHLEMREAILEGALRQAKIPVPPAPDYQDSTYPAPPLNGYSGPAGPIDPDPEGPGAL